MNEVTLEPALIRKRSMVIHWSQLPRIDSEETRALRAQVPLSISDFSIVKRTVTSPLSLIPGTLLLALILLAQKLIALFMS